MKNILNIDNGIPTLLSNVDDGTNTLYINDELVPSSEWTGTGYYTFTSGGLTFTIQKIRDDSGNIMLQLIEQSGGTSYRLIKYISNAEKYYSIDDPAETDLADGDYVPFYDTSAGAKKKSLWSNIVAKLKSIFLPLITNGGIGRSYGSGSYGWVKIATLTVTSVYINGPVVFEVSQREYAFSLLQVSFISGNTTDPSLGYFITDNDNHYYIKKVATSIWEIYGKYSETYGGLALHRISGFRVGDGINVTVNMENIAEPTGVTQVSYGGNVNYATSAGSATNSTNATKVNNWYNSRPTSANVQFGDGFLRHFKATSSMSTGKPTIGDGHIIHLAWDYNNGYDVQLAIGNSNSGIQFRSQLAGAWQNWLTLIHSGNIGSQSVNYATSAGSASSATNATNANYATSAGSANSVAWGNVSGKPGIGYAAGASTGSIGSVIVTHPSTGGDGSRGQMFAYGNGNGIPWAMAIQYGYTYVRCVFLCGAADKVGVRFISATQFAIISGAWDYPTVIATTTDFSVATSTTSYTIDTSNTNRPLAYDNTKLPLSGGSMSGALDFSETSGMGIAFHKGSYYVKLGNMNQSGQVALTANRYVQFPNSSGTIAFASSSRRVKKNIRNMTEEEALKILDIDVIKFDYKDDWCGGEKNRSGFIAEDVMDILPETVQVSKNYDPNLPVDELYNFPPEMDYQRIIPYIVKMVQMQQKEIDDLKNKIKALMEG